MKMKEKTIPVSEFKARCLKILDQLNGESLIVTKHGHPIARVAPLDPPDNSTLIGLMKGKVLIKGDIFSTGRKWNAQSRHARSDRPAHR